MHTVTIVLILAALALIPAGNAHADHGKSLQVTIPSGASSDQAGITFYPNILPFDRHDTITWVNEDSAVHSVTSGIPAHPDYSGVFFKTDDIDAARSSTIGTDNLTNFAYYYFCQIHPWMTGKLVLASAPESLPETHDAIVAKSAYVRGEDATITGSVAADFAYISYQILVYEYPDRLIGVKEGRFNDASYSQIINTDSMSGKYTIRLVYGLPTQVATWTFDVTEKDIGIPAWIKSEARWWSSGMISDSEFTKAIEYMVKEKVLTLQKADAGHQKPIPSWLRTNAGWWADGMITDVEFASGLQYLVDNGIVKI